MSRLLAFDLSTTVVGYSFFDIESQDLIECSYYKFEEDELIDRGRELKLLLQKLFSANDISLFVIEERLKSFRQGGTNADAMLKTAQLNFYCQSMIMELGVPVKEINVNTARSACFEGFHTIARATKGVKHKEIAFKMAISVLGEDFFPKKVLKSGPRKGETVYLDEAMDMADSWVLGRAFLFPKVEKPKKPKKKKA